MGKNLKIPVYSKDLGIPDFNQEISKKIDQGLSENFVRNALFSIISRESQYIDDIEGLGKKFSKTVFEIISKNGKNKIDVLCRNIPTDCLFLRENGWGLFENQKKQISHAIRDLLVQPNEYGPLNSPIQYTRAMVARAGLIDLNRKDVNRRTFVWGGHNVPSKEYKYASKIGYYDAACNATEFITGCGPNIMEAPFIGAIPAYIARNKIKEKNFIGFTEPRIIDKETPNALINKLIIFRNIAERMMAFIAASSRGRVHEGGVGTLQEISTFLSVISHENNKGLIYPFDLIGSHPNSIMKTFQAFFEMISKKDLNKFMTFHFEISPKKFAEYVVKTNKKIPLPKDWNDKIYFPEDVQSPFKPEFDTMEKIDLSRNQPLSNLIKNIGDLMDSYVEFSVRQPLVPKSWGKDRPLIKGDADILKATNDLIIRFFREKRLHDTGFGLFHRTT